MVKLLIVAVLLGASTYILHSKHGSVMAPVPPAKVDQLKTKINVTMRSFYLPQVNGKVLSFCLSNWNRCGKPAADAFCRSKGFKEAFTFQRIELQASTTTNFRQINCGQHRTKTADAVSRFQP